MSVLIPDFIENLYPEAVEMYRTLHRTPELLYDLPITSAFVASYLKNLGLEVYEKVGISGVVGIIRNSGPCIILRADMDALPINEEADVDYKSNTPNMMHACGHDGHVTMLLLAAKLLKNTQGLNGTIKFVFQPAEEGGAGAKAMRDDGVLENVDEVYGLHLGSGLKYGDYLYNDTYMSTNSDRFSVNIIGKGGHGSSPANTIDPIPVTASLILSFNKLVANTELSVRISTNIVTTPRTYNAIPRVSTIKGSTRSISNADRENIERRMREICDGFQKMYGVTVEFEYTKLYSAVCNSDQCSQYALRAIQQTTQGARHQKLAMIGEDFSFFSQERPGAYIIISAADENSPSMHSNKFKINDRSLLIGITYWYNLVKARLS